MVLRLRLMGEMWDMIAASKRSDPHIGVNLCIRAAQYHHAAPLTHTRHYLRESCPAVFEALASSSHAALSAFLRTAYEPVAEPIQARDQVLPFPLLIPLSLLVLLCQARRRCCERCHGNSVCWHRHTRNFRSPGGSQRPQHCILPLEL